LIDLQRIHINILTDASPSLNLVPFLSLFARWRADKNHPAGWVDLADYAHVPRGAGVALIGSRANFSFDLAGPAPGILYVARKGLAGVPAERFAAALKSCLELTQRLVTEPEFPREVHLRTDTFEISFPDRLETPNDMATDQALRPAVRQVLDRLFGTGCYALTSQADPSEALGYSVIATKAESLDTLLMRLS